MKLSLNEIYVLSSLSNGEQYGLGIIKEVKESGIELYLGSLYTILRRLEKQKYIKGYYKEETEDRAGNRRRYYKILAAGERALGEARRALMELWGVKILNSSMPSPLKDMFLFLLRKGECIFSILKRNLVLILVLAPWLALVVVLVLWQGEPQWQWKAEWTGRGQWTGIVLGIMSALFTGMILRIDQIMLKYQSLRIETGKSLKEKLFSLRFLLPKKYREEIVGDLMEIKNKLKEEGHGKSWILTILIGQFISLIYHMIFFKISETYEKKVSRKKEEINEELELVPFRLIERKHFNSRTDYMNELLSTEDELLNYEDRKLKKETRQFVDNLLRKVKPKFPSEK